MVNVWHISSHLVQMSVLIVSESGLYITTIDGQTVKFKYSHPDVSAQDIIISNATVKGMCYVRCRCQNLQQWV